MEFTYSVITFPHWIAFKVYRKKFSLLSEDFEAWCSRHKQDSISKHQAFVKLMKWYPEYRYVFYYRLPFYLRHLLNFLLHRREMRISVKETVGGVLLLNTVGAQ